MHFFHDFSQKICFFVAVFFVTNTHAVTPFSQYGMIQNVQNYANNPFYNPNTAQITTPKIVYATGPSLKPDDCTRAVQNIVEIVCSNNNNCQNTTLADVRPSIMIQLSTLPGNNYAYSCSGYIDTIYENYKKRTGYPTYMPTTNSFPTAANTTTQKSTYQSRAAELKALQSVNAVDTTVNDTDFPTTINDLSRDERIALQEASYADYMDTQAYVSLDLPDEMYGSRAANGNNADVYACIKKYGDNENAAESNWANAKKSLASDLATKQKAMEQAWSDALLSPCNCTKNTALQKIMGMYDICSANNQKKQDWVKQQIQQYKTKMGV